MQKIALIAAASVAATLAARQQGKTVGVGHVQITGKTDYQFATPDRISIDRDSKWYVGQAAAFIGVRFNDEEVTNCVEFCASEGWVRLALSGRVPVPPQEVRAAQRTEGKVEVFWRTVPSRQVRRQIARLS